MTCTVKRIGQAQRVGFIHFIPQTGDRADAVRLRLAWCHQRHARAVYCALCSSGVRTTTTRSLDTGVQHITITIQIPAKPVLASNKAGISNTAAQIRTFATGHGAAAIGLDVLIARLDVESQAVSQRQAQLGANVAGVRRVVPAVEFGAAGARRISRAIDPSRDHAGIVDLVLALLRGDREAVARIRTGNARRRVGQALRQVGAQRQRTEEVVAVLVVVARQREEVIAAQRLIDLRVVLLLVDLAIVVERIVVRRAAGRHERAQAAFGQIAGFNLHEQAHEVIFTRRTRQHDAHVVVGLLRAQVDGAANCRRGRAVDVGGAEVDVDLLDQFRIDLLVRIDRIVARIVQRHAVEGQADAVGREAADRERTTRRTIGVVVLEADAGDLVDRVEDRLAGVLALDVLSGQDGLGLRRVGSRNPAHFLGAAAGPGDDDFLFEIDRTDRLGKRRGGKSGNTDGEATGGCGQGRVEAHGEVNPCYGTLKLAGQPHGESPFSADWRRSYKRSGAARHPNCYRFVTATGAISQPIPRLWNDVSIRPANA